MSDDDVECGHTWPLVDPNEEDRRTGAAHHCTLRKGHADWYLHRCVCGELDTPS